MTRFLGISGSLRTGNRLVLSRACGVFDDGGALADNKVGDELAGFMHGLAALMATARD